VLLRAFVGGARHPEYLEQDDETLAAQSLGELRRLMGPLGEPRLVRVFRYGQGNPQPELGHTGRLGRIRAHLERSPGLFLVGAGYGGVGIPDCVRQAREAVRVLLEG
jgi:oxygen-dependent protoporphyrinogen oxidase